MPYKTLTPIRSFKLQGAVIDFKWNPHCNQIAVLSESELDEYPSRFILTKIAMNGESISTDFEEHNSGFNWSNSIDLSDDGNHIAVFFDEKVRIYSCVSRAFVAELNAKDIGENGHIRHGGGFFNNEELFLELDDYNDRYWTTWNWQEGTLNWNPLEVELETEHFPDGFTFECHGFKLHPSKKMLFGLADFDHGGYYLKVFYLLPPENGVLKCIYLNRENQIYGDKFLPRFNAGGDKLGMLEETDHDHFAIQVYDINNMGEPLYSFKLDGDRTTIEDLLLLQDEKFILLSHANGMKLIDMVHSKIVEEYPEFSGKICSDLQHKQVCLAHKDEIRFYEFAHASFHYDEVDLIAKTDDFITKNSDKLLYSNKLDLNIYSWSYENLVPHFPNNYIPTLKAHYGFLHATYDIRNKKLISGDLMPDSVKAAIDTWFNANQEPVLQNWVDYIESRKKYVIEEDGIYVEFYPLTEEERKKEGARIYMVYENTVQAISFFHKLKTPIFPEPVTQAIEEWYFDHFDEITEPWKEVPYYANFVRPDKISHVLDEASAVGIDLSDEPLPDKQSDDQKASDAELPTKVKSTRIWSKLLEFLKR